MGRKLALGCVVPIFALVVSTCDAEQSVGMLVRR